jgi:hypothetical protein
MPVRLMCTEWERVNVRPEFLIRPSNLLRPPIPAGALRKAQEAPAAPGSPWTLTAPENAPPRAARAPQKPSARERAIQAYRATLAKDEVIMADVAPGDPIPMLDPHRVEALSEVCTEVRLATADLGDVFLVREKTAESASRTELTFDDAATLATIVAAFPGSRVVKVRGRP